MLRSPFWNAEGLQRGRKLQNSDVSRQARAPGKELYRALSRYRIGEMPVHKNEVCRGERHGARATPLSVRSVRDRWNGATCTIFSHLKALLRDRVLPPMDGGEWICRIESRQQLHSKLAVAWPKLTVDVASALSDSAWSDHGG